MEKIEIEKEKGNIIYQVSYESNLIIDTKGLSFAIKRALNNSLKKIKNSMNLQVDIERLFCILHTRYSSMHLIKKKKRK